MEKQFYAYSLSLRFFGLLPTTTCKLLRENEKLPLHCFIYPFLTILLVWFNVVRLVVACLFLWNGSGQLPDYLFLAMLIVYYLACAICRTTFIYKSWKGNCVIEAVQLSLFNPLERPWNQFERFHSSVQNGFRKTYRLAIFIGWFYVLFNNAQIIVLEFYGFNGGLEQSVLLAPFDRFNPFSGFPNCLLIVLQLLCSIMADAGMIFPLGYVMVLLLYIARQFKELTNWIKSRRTPVNMSKLSINLKLIHDTFFAITNASRRLNKVVRIQIGVQLVFCFFGVLVNMYQMVWIGEGDSNGMLRLTFGVWFSFSTFLFISIMIPSIIVSNFAEQVKEQVRKCSISQFDGPNDQYKMSMLLVIEQRSNLEPVGLSFFNLKYIRSETLVAVS